MKISILGTGVVGTAIGTKLVQLGHEVKMGSRTAGNQKAVEWVKTNGSKATQGTFSDAAGFGEIVFNCTSGKHAIEALKLAGEKNLNGKIIIDISNPLEFSGGALSLTVCNTDSLGEQIQRAFPVAKVVKTLNTVNSSVMVEPSLISGNHGIFISGNDPAAKVEVTKILKEWFGWQSVIDLGDISGARAQEMLLPLWMRLMGVYGSPIFNLSIVR
jgi:predicted dinucleotide-binding enzyme